MILRKDKIPEKTSQISKFDLQLLWLIKQHYPKTKKKYEDVLNYIVKNELMPRSSFFVAKRNLIKNGILEEEKELA